MDLLTNATVVDDAIRFVSQKSKDKKKLEHPQVIQMEMEMKQVSMTMMKIS